MPEDRMEFRVALFIKIESLCCLVLCKKRLKWESVLLEGRNLAALSVWSCSKLLVVKYCLEAASSKFLSQLNTLHYPGIIYR
jgi:hypothetical protein